MTLVRALLALLVKTFAADLVMTLTALCAVALSAVSLSTGLLSPQQTPYALTLGVLAALTIGVVRGDKR